MELTAYELALIAGGFGIAGTLIGVLATYRLSMKVSDRQFEHLQHISKLDAFHAAAREFRSAFTHTLGVLESGVELPRGTQVFLLEQYDAQLEAVLAFEQVLPLDKRPAFAQAWKEYHSGQTVSGEPFEPADYAMSVRGSLFLEYSTEWGGDKPDQPAHQLAAQRIRALLIFAEFT